MRILLHSAYYAPELISIGKYNAEMAVWLQARGHQVRVVTMPPHYPAWRVMDGHSAGRYTREVLQGVPVWRCPTWIPSQPSGLRRMLWMASFALASLPVLLRQCFWRPDVVIGVEPPLLGVAPALLCARLCGAASWLHVQDLEVDAAFDLGILKGQRARSVALWIERTLMRGCDRVSTISLRMRERLLEKGMPPDRVPMLRNWVETPPDAAHEPPGTQTGYRRDLGLRDGDRLALYAGNMGAKQGLETVIDTARLLAHRKELHFLLVGEGPAQAALRAAAQGLDRVHFLPLQPAERLAELLRSADVHLLPQRAAAADLVMPSKLGGMLASGRPTVAGSRPGTELAQMLQGRGLAVMPEDAQAFADAIVELIDDPARCAALGAAARACARAEFSRDAVLGRFEEELLKLAGPGAQARAADDAAT